MSEDVQDVLQRTEWPFTERRRRRYIAMQTKEARRSFRFATGFFRASSRLRSKEETDVWRFAAFSLLSWSTAWKFAWQKKDTGMVSSLRPEMKANSREEPSCVARNNSELAIRH